MLLCCLCCSFCSLSQDSRAAVIVAQEKSEVETMKGDLGETKKYWTLAESCGIHSSEWEERKKNRSEGGAHSKTVL